MTRRDRFYAKLGASFGLCGAFMSAMAGDRPWLMIFGAAAVGMAALLALPLEEGKSE